MLPRRGVLAAAIAVPASGLVAPLPAQALTGADAPSVPGAGVLRFRMMRHGSQIGTHVVTFARAGTALRVEVAVEATVKFGPIPLYRYRHHAVETWDGGTVSGLATNTDRNGTLLQMQAERQTAGLAVQGSGTKPYVAPPTALATTYWNKRMLDGPMIGSQDGELMHPTVTALGPDSVTNAAGAVIQASRYAVRGKVHCDLWYDAANTWVAMAFGVDDGSEISYVPEA